MSPKGRKETENLEIPCARKSPFPGPVFAGTAKKRFAKNTRHSTVVECRVFCLFSYSPFGKSQEISLFKLRPCGIEGMQQLMRFMAARFFQILLIKLIDLRVFMRFADRLIRIFPIQTLCPFHSRIQNALHFGGHDRLPTTVYAAAWASHDFDEVIVFFSRFNGVQQLFRIASSGSDGYMQLFSSDIYCLSVPAR